MLYLCAAMYKNEITSPHYEELSDRIFEIMAEKGLSSTTMDYLAKKLTISKRTLYEIFGSKDDMIKAILERMEKCHSDQVEEIIKRSANVMEALAEILLFHQKAMQRLSAKFFRDMDIRYRHLRSEYDNNTRKWRNSVWQAIKLGVRQGVLRKDVNYNIMLPLFHVQMESLKRMEEFFPAEITLIDAYRTLALGTLRSIATAKGMETLEKLTPKFHSM